MGWEGTERAGNRSHRLLVSVGNPDHVEQLMRTAVDVARERDGEILVLGVIHRPRESPLALLTDEAIKRDFGGDRREIVDRAVAVAEGTGVPVTGEVRVSHDLARAVLGATRDHEVDALLVGWHERPRSDFVLGSNVDRIVYDARCDVIVEKIGPQADGVESLLVPTTGSPHAAFAAEIAGAIARANGARVEVLYVLAPGTPDRHEAGRILEETAATLEGVDVETRTEEAPDVADAIVARAGAHDITVLGHSRESLLEQHLFGAIPRAVGRRAPCTVVMAKRYLGVTSRLRRWFRGFRPADDR